MPYGNQRDPLPQTKLALVSVVGIVDQLIQPTPQAEGFWLDAPQHKLAFLFPISADGLIGWRRSDGVLAEL